MKMNQDGTNLYDKYHLSDEPLRIQVTPLRKQIRSCKQIGTQLGVCHKRVARVIRNMPDPAIPVLERYAERDICANEIGKRHGVKPAVVYAILKEGPADLQRRFSQMAAIAKKRRKAAYNKARRPEPKRPAVPLVDAARCTLKELAALQRMGVPRYDARAA